MDLSMAEEEVDFAVPRDDEVVDLTVDDDDWDEIEVPVLLQGGHGTRMQPGIC